MLWENRRMKIDKIHLKGFRNFDDTEIVFQKKTLIIGANDIGKTNLLYALRILFDKSISEQELELNDSDYNAYTKANTIEITATLSDVTEDCLVSVFVGAIKDDCLIIRYSKSRGESYKIYIGYNEENLNESPTRHYIKRLNMQCVNTNRDLFTFLRREKSQILQLSKERLSQEAVSEDEQNISIIQSSLDMINSQISSLNYISTALENVNRELAELSVHNEDQTVRFVAGNSDANKVLDNLMILYSSEQAPLSIGGDGRNNQIFLATWIAKQNIQQSVDHVTFYAIEEPEAHLHPHQQRKLAEYIQRNIIGQVFVTTHSPHIASRFDPKSIIRLYSKNKITFAACGGCSEMLLEVFNDFGYRLNALSAETFFSDGVFLVEGTSEVLLYTALSQEIGIELDRYNISILSVEGVGFKPYVAICDALNIPWVLRTDNDIFTKTKNGSQYDYYSGITRLVGIAQIIKNGNEELLQYWESNQEKNEWGHNNKVPEEAIMLNTQIRQLAKQLGIFLSDEDLEHDLTNSALRPYLINHYNKKTTKTIVEAMQKRKAQNMYSFLATNHERLRSLKESEMVDPLQFIQTAVIERTRPDHE